MYVADVVLDPALLWLWLRLASAAPISPLAWELPYVTGVALKSKKKKKRKKERKERRNLISIVVIQQFIVLIILINKLNFGFLYKLGCLLPGKKLLHYSYSCVSYSLNSHILKLLSWPIIS